MTIALDATYSFDRHLSGVGVYSNRILSGLAESHPETRFQWCCRLHRLRQAMASPRPRNAAIRPLFENVQIFRPRLFHGLNQRMPESRFQRSVCTFHDLFVFTSDYSSPEFRARFTQQARDAAARADLFICVSEFTASQLVDLLGVDRSLIRVIPHGAVLPVGPLPETRGAIVLHTGAIQHRKNLLRLVAAFERAAPAPWRLVLAGSDGYGAAAIHARIAASSARDRIETPGWIDDAALESLYGRASIFAFPSLDEGFGIPVLEAMAHALPVLASDRSALPEACGEAALLVNPLSEDQIAGALEALIADESLRRRLSQAGHARAALFPWERAAEATWNVYRELLG